MSKETNSKGLDLTALNNALYRLDGLPKNTAKSIFTTIDGTAWANALPAARERRKGQGKRIAEAIKRHACAKCGSAGSYYYDENHAKPCEQCCPHDQGWWQLTEAHQGYVAGADNACCRAGCGQMRRDLLKQNTRQPAAD